MNYYSIMHQPYLNIKYYTNIYIYIYIHLSVTPTAMQFKYSVIHIYCV